MDVYTFAIKYWYLFTALIVIVIMLIINELKLKGSAQSSLSAQQLLQLHNADAVKIYDLRDHADYKKGHIPEAISLPFTELTNHIESLKNANKTLLFYCQNGMRSHQALSQLAKAGIEAKQLNGGLAAWLTANLPTQKSR